VPGQAQLDFSLTSMRTGSMILTPEMCRAARALLNWKAHQLATEAGLGPATVRRFEAGGTIRLSSVEAMYEALQGAGLEFIAAGGKSVAGVRDYGPSRWRNLRSPPPKRPLSWTSQLNRHLPNLIADLTFAAPPPMRTLKHGRYHAPSEPHHSLTHQYWCVREWWGSEGA